MSEKILSRKIVNVLKHTGAHVQRHEDKNTAGIPDLSYGVRGRAGWIELKYLKKWPVKKSTPIRLRNFTAAQKKWLYEYGMLTGGNCFLILQVEKDFLIFGWQSIRQLNTKDLNATELKKQADLVLKEKNLYDFVDFII